MGDAQLEGIMAIVVAVASPAVVVSEIEVYDVPDGSWYATSVSFVVSL